MVKKILFLLLLLPALVAADADTLLTCEEYGYRVANFMNLSDSGGGTAKLDSGQIQTYIRMAFGTISRAIAIEKTKYLQVTNGTRKYLVDEGLISVRDASRIKNKSSTPLIEIQDLGVLAVDSVLMKRYVRESDGTDSVKFFEIHGDSIRVLPTPKTTDSVLIEYYARPSHPDAVNDTVYLPYEYKNALIYLAAYLCEVSVRGPMQEVYKTMFVEEAADIKLRMTDKWRVQ